MSDLHCAWPLVNLLEVSAGFLRRFSQRVCERTGMHLSVHIRHNWPHVSTHFVTHTSPGAEGFMMYVSAPPAECYINVLSDSPKGSTLL